ncbi:MAG: hypothetical protein C0618_12320 [Desulfuromonas sp.]|nr:MAG: hypothetical protein C0618_12320 [Desulfuromonas sp.]
MMRLNQKGMSVILAVATMLILGFIAAAAVGLLQNREISSGEELLSTQALFLAETGVEIAINEGLLPGPSTTYNYGDGNIDVRITSLGVLDGQTILQVDSTGTIGSINRQVRVKYRP